MTGLTVLVLLIPITSAFTPYCTPDTTSTPGPNDPTLPNIPDQYQAVIEGNIVDRNMSATAREFFDGPGNKATVQLMQNGMLTWLIFDYQTVELFYVKGDTCMITNLTTDDNNVLFGDKVVNGTMHTFSTAGTLHFAKKFQRYKGRATVRGIAVDRWQSCLYWPQLKSNFTLDYYFTVYNWTDPVLYPQIPVRALARGVQIQKDGTMRNFTHIYDYVDFQPVITDPTVFETPPGVACTGRKQVRPIPTIPRYFHYKEEIVSKGNNKVENFDIWYDGINRLVRFDYRGAFPNGDSTIQTTISEVHDFNYGIRYIQDQLTDQCLALPLLTNSTSDSSVIQTNDTSYSVTMKSALQFLDLDGTYDYVGTRTVRGLPCDSYVARRTTNFGGFQNVEAVYQYYFLQKDFKLYSDDNSDTPPEFIPVQIELFIDALGEHVTYNILDFNKQHPAMSVFNVMSCYSESAKLQFQVVMQGKFYNGVREQLLVESHRELVATMGVSPVRVQAVKVDYDNVNVYITAMLLDRSPYSAQFTYRYHKEIPKQDDLVYSTIQVASISDCAQLCVLNSNFTCNSFDYCLTDPTHICRLSRAHIADGKSVLIDSYCDHFSRTVTGPVKPELSMADAYANLERNLPQLTIQTFLPSVSQPIMYTAVRSSVVFGRLYPQSLPTLAGVFSYNLEISVPKMSQVFNAHIWYDFQYQLVRFDSAMGGPSSTIHDYNSGLQYSIDLTTNQCVVTPIPPNAFDDLTPPESQYNTTGYTVTLKNPLQFLDISQKFQYVGQRTIRGILCDVYEYVDKFNFGAQKKDAVLQFYFMTKYWHELSSGSGIPVAYQPIALTATATDFSGTAKYQFYDFSEQHSDLSTYNIAPCFTGLQQQDFAIGFNHSYHPVLEKNLEAFRKNVLEELSVLTGVSPLRFQNPKVVYDNNKTFYLATLTQQAPFILDFTKISDRVSVYSSDASYPGVTSDDQCAGLCRNMTGFTCLSFDFCPSTQLCQLSKRHVMDGKLLPTNVSCDHYSKTVDFQGRPEPTVDQTLSMLQDRVQLGTLKIPLQTVNYGNATFIATGLNRNVLRGVPGQANSDTLSHFKRTPSTSIDFKDWGGTFVRLTDSSVDGCGQQCLSWLAFQCQSYTYCADLGMCFMSNLHPDKNASYVMDSTACDLYSRRYTDHYTKYPGQVIQATTNVYKFPLESVELCAKMCDTFTQITCKSFNYCGQSKTCFLMAVHILNIPKVQIVTSSTCSHYSKKYLYDFVKTPKKALTIGKTLHFEGVSAEMCGSLCVENVGYRCNSFTFCGNSTACTISSVSTSAAKSQISSSPNCDIYTRQYYPAPAVTTSNPSVSTTTPAAPSSAAHTSSTPGNTNLYTGSTQPGVGGPQAQHAKVGYSAGSMGGVAIGTLLAGMIIGAIIIHFTKRTDSKETPNLHEMSYVNPSQTESDS